MQVPYLMHIPELDELWLIDGEQRFLITPKIYDLLVSNGADLPPAYGIDALREQNAKLREAVDYLYGFAKTCGVDADRMRELGVEVEA